MAKAPDSANSAKASNQAKAPNSAKASQSKRTNASSATRGASTHSLGIADKVKSVGVHHRETCLKTLRDLLDSWLASLMTWLLIGVALALPVFLYLLLTNTMALGKDFDGTARMSLYLNGEVDKSLLMEELKNLPEILDVKLIEADDALSSFQAESGFSDILSSLPVNPLPDVIELQPQDSSPLELELLSKSLQSRPEISRVAVDLEWLRRLQALLLFGERFVYTLAAFLAIGVALAIGNTIRLAIENRRSEIEIIKLVGATDAFVRRPFLYLGFWYGFGGALVAWILVQFSFLLLGEPIEALMLSYQNQFTLQGLGFGVSLLMFALGSGLGVAGSAVAVSRHLHTIEPA